MTDGRILFIIVGILTVSLVIFADVTSEPTTVPIEVHHNEIGQDVILIQNSEDILLHDKMFNYDIIFGGMYDNINKTESIGTSIGFSSIPRFVDSIEVDYGSNQSVLVTNRPLLLTINTKLILTEEDWNKIVK